MEHARAGDLGALQPDGAMARGHGQAAGGSRRHRHAGRCDLPVTGAERRLAPRDASALRTHLGRAALELEAGGPDIRLRDAVGALLLALRTHFPTAARDVCSAPAIDALVPSEPNGRDIKLARIARARLAEYL